MLDAITRRLFRHLSAALLVSSIATIGLAGWLQVSFATALMLVGVNFLTAAVLSIGATRRAIEPLRQLTDILRKGEKPSDLLLRELGDLGVTVAEMWQRWQQVVTEGRSEQALLTAIVERMEEGVIATDEHGNVLWVNPSARRLFSLPADTLRRRLTELNLPFELLALVQQALRSGNPQSAEVQWFHPDERFLDAYATPLSVNGRPIGALLVVRDLTNLKRLERVRKDFIANVSHELRTPIATLRSLAEALLMGGKEDPAVCDQFLQAIADEVERVGRLLDNLLDLARLEAGRREWHWQSVLVSDCVAQVAERFKPFAEGKGLKITVRAEPDLIVRTDPEALMQILSNLLDNAVKYTERGEIAVVAERLETADGDWVTIHVCDTGVGIPPEHLPRIFERFYRVDRARSRRQGGFGLGLSIAKHLAESLGGKITVQSEVGKGSTFTLWLPIGSQEGIGNGSVVG